MQVKYDKSTLVALKASIRKWERIVDGSGEDFGVKNCALCLKFYSQNCQHCPVFLTTHRIWCDDSPYENWNKYFYERSKRIRTECIRKVTDEHTKKLAQAELDFLKSLIIQ